jgi:hypothetical protein
MRRSERLDVAAGPGVDSISLELASGLLRRHPAQVASAATRHEAHVGQAPGLSTAIELAAWGGDWTRPDGITVFKSVGTAVQDLVAAHVVATAARYRDREDPPRRGARLAPAAGGDELAGPRTCQCRRRNTGGERRLLESRALEQFGEVLIGDIADLFDQKRQLSRDGSWRLSAASRDRTVARRGWPVALGPAKPDNA